MIQPFGAARRKMASTLSAAVIGSVCLLPTVVFGQAADQDRRPTNSGFATDDPFRGASSSIEISTDEKKAKAEFGYAGYLAGRGSPSPSGGRRLDISWNVGLSLPIGGKSDIIDKGTLEKLGDGTKFSGGLTLLNATSSPDSIYEDSVTRLMIQACRAEAGNDPEKNKECDSWKSQRNREGYLRDHAPWLGLQLNRALYGSFWTLEAEGAVSLARYKYVDVSTLEDRKQSINGYSATAIFAFYPRDAVSKFKVEAEYSSAGKSVDATIVCKTVVVSPADDCKFGAANSPERDNALVIRSGYARYFPFRTGDAGIGLELTGSKDLLSDDWAVQLPIYVTIPGISDVSPGMKASYGSEDGANDFTVNIFIKSTFSFK
jgi:hypothetical protein